METPELKRRLIRLIGDLLDEQTLAGVDSFIEMAEGVIHVTGDVEGGEKYFRVTLVETVGLEYFKPYDPGPAVE